MIIQTLGSYLSSQVGLYPATVSTNATGPTIDRQGYDHLLLQQMTTSFSGTPTFVIKVQHATVDLSTAFADYTPDFLYANNATTYTTAAFPTVTTNGTSKLDVDLQKANRYLRLVSTITGTTSALQSVSAYLAQREGPVPGATG